MFEYDFTALAPGMQEVCGKAYESDAGIKLEPETGVNELGTPGQKHSVTASIPTGTDGAVSGVDTTISIISGPNMGVTCYGPTDKFLLSYTAIQGHAGLRTEVIQACFIIVIFPGQVILVRDK